MPYATHEPFCHDTLMSRKPQVIEQHRQGTRRPGQNLVHGRLAGRKPPNFERHPESSMMAYPPVAVSELGSAHRKPRLEEGPYTATSCHAPLPCRRLSIHSTKALAYVEELTEKSPNVGNHLKVALA